MIESRPPKSEARFSIIHGSTQNAAAAASRLGYECSSSPLLHTVLLKTAIFYPISAYFKMDDSRRFTDALEGSRG